LTDEIEAADQGTITLSERIAAIEGLVADQQSAVENLSVATDTALGQRHEQLDALSAALGHTRTIIDDMVETANGQLVASLLRVRETTRQAAESSRKIVEDELNEIAGSISERNKDALAAAVAEQVQAMDSAMQDALQRNLTLSDAIDTRIHDQLAQLQEMVGNLEQRIAQAHGSFAGIDDEGFTRRMALLTESLNSAAIDVAKILSNDVTDTSWAAYLKGDRGVFTRRAVRLLDSGEVKAVGAHYDDDAEFRENVNRYIHDFEAMMRVLLSTRDGNAIGVTILSSDVGKLYVALAQAIERLRS
jgi:prophage DNA circulation protein